MADINKPKLSEYTNYIIITAACILMGFVPPMLGAVMGLGLNLPTTVAGWIVWTVLQVCNSVANCLMFYAFTAQGKDNIKQHPSYIKATELLRVNKIYKEISLISPQEWERKGWFKKMAWMAVGTLLGGIALTQAVMAFDVVRFFTQIITIVFGILFGLFQMKKTEEMYSDYYLEYAEQQVRIKKDEELEAQTTDYLEITTTSTIERTRQIPLKENENV